jgi:hypothetical protein
MLENILLPPMALVGWTLIVLTLVPIARFRASARKEVNAGDFRNGESERVSPRVSLPNRNFMNLTEAPVLFYGVCLIAHLAGIVGPVMAGLAWAYVVFRVIHSLIHLTTNNVMYRLTAFAVSNIALLAMWAIVGRQMLAATVA